MNIERIFSEPRSGRQNLVLIIFTGLVFYGCAGQENTRSALTGARLMEKIGSGWNPLILDVRSTLEYNAGHVPGARHVSFWTPLFNREEIPADAEKPVVVYCEHGPRAYIAFWGLKHAGFKDIHLLDGHMSQWRKDALRIENPDPD
ncbi:MAG: rhodanese-like domain-containing protein [Methylococcaceae bacterium]|nr:rhodanese-like domain-containing protein [Methylococcaceae bacterium]